MTKKEKNMEKVFISIMSNLLKDEAKVIKKHKFYSRFLHYVFLIYIAIITVFYARNQGEGQAIFMLCHGVILGSLLWLSIWFEAASLQLPIMKRYWDIEKFYKETGEYDIFD